MGIRSTLGIVLGQAKATLIFLAKNGVRCYHLWLLSPGSAQWLHGSHSEAPHLLWGSCGCLFRAQSTVTAQPISQCANIPTLPHHSKTVASAVVSALDDGDLAPAVPGGQQLDELSPEDCQKRLSISHACAGWTNPRMGLRICLASRVLNVTACGVCDDYLFF